MMTADLGARWAAPAMFGMLLDRSIARIGELAADGRFFDRNEVARLADVWDNNTAPFFRVATAGPAWCAERRARAALRWTAAAGPERRAWMIDEAERAGFRWPAVLGRPEPEPAHHRDYAGVVQPGTEPLTVPALASIARDYDLARADVRTLRVERAGAALTGVVAVVAPRRYAAPDAPREAVVQLFLDDVRSVRFDSADAAGAVVTADAGGVEVRIGAEGRLRAAGGQARFDDPAWHRSAAGRAADAGTPRQDAGRRSPPRAVRSRLSVSVENAAVVLQQAMWQIRSVRYARLVGRHPLPELCTALAHAGRDVLDAAGRRGAARDRAFARLAAGWIERSPALAAWLDRHDGTPRAPRPPAAGFPERGQLTLGGYTAAHVAYGTARAATATINLAVPDGSGGWALRAAELPRPVRMTVDTTAFAGPHAIVHRDGAEFVLGDALTIRHDG